MASEEDKRRTLARFARQLRHFVDHDEAQRRKRNAKAKPADPGRKPPRRRSDWDDDEPTFEKIRRKDEVRPAPAGTEVPPSAVLPRATVAAVHAGRIELDDGRVARVATRLLVDPEFTLAAGDDVSLVVTDDAVRIVARAPRRTWLGRPDPGNPHRWLVLAANVDVAVIVVAVADPPLRPGLIDRFLLALAAGGVAPLVAVNKVDLARAPADAAALAAQLAPYGELGVPVVPCAALAGDGVDALRAAVVGKTCVFVGHSGVGKSSLLNALDPAGERRVGAVREHDGRGRHTTSSARMRTLGDGTRVIDTPGVRAFGLGEIPAEAVRAGFPEFTAFARGCRFGDCAHRAEPGCAVRAATAAEPTLRARYASYLRILEGE